MSADPDPSQSADNDPPVDPQPGIDSVDGESDAAPPTGPEALEIPDDLSAVLDSVVAERDALAADLAEQQDGYARLAADFDNFRKRTARTRDEEVARAAGRIIEALLPVLDGCDAAVQQGVEGVQPIIEALLAALGKEGLDRLDPVNDVFDPVHHDAVVSEPPDDGAATGVTIVVETMRPGYLWRDQVLRPAMVKVQEQ